LEDLKTTFPDVNFIGIRVLASRDAGAFIRTYCGYNGELHDKVMKDWRSKGHSPSKLLVIILTLDSLAMFFPVTLSLMLTMVPPKLKSNLLLLKVSALRK
jgi:hypothetical protein